MATIKRRLLRTTVALTLIAALGACVNDDKAADFAGHWTSNEWGEHYILVDGSTMKIIYTHDDGRVMGTLDGTTFTGWWTESPSRQPSTDAGEVEFMLTRTDDKNAVDGTWRYGTGGVLRDNWDLVWVDTTIPADVAAKFADASMFAQHP